MNRLTRRQAKALKVVSALQAKLGREPTARELAKPLGLSSPSAAKRLMSRINERIAMFDGVLNADAIARALSKMPAREVLQVLDRAHALRRGVEVSP